MGGQPPTLPSFNEAKSKMSTDPQPTLLEILAHVPTDLSHCSHCERLFDVAGIGSSVHREMRGAYPPEILAEARRLATWLQNLSTRYGNRLHIRIVDPQSPEGFLKSLRYGVRRYPAFIINRRAKYVGWEPTALDRLLAQHLSAPTASDTGGTGGA